MRLQPEVPTTDCVEPATPGARVALGCEPLGNDDEALRAWIPHGATCRLTATRKQAARLVSMVTAMIPDRGTRLVVLGADVDRLSAAARAALRASIAILPMDGGLISHLDAWENIVLPLGFHHPEQLHTAEDRVPGLVRRFGIEPRALLPKLLEDMTPFEAQVTAFIRLLLERPELVVAEDGGESFGHRAALDDNDSTGAGFAGIYREACPSGTFVQLRVRQAART